MKPSFSRTIRSQEAHRRLLHLKSQQFSTLKDKQEDIDESFWSKQKSQHEQLGGRHDRDREMGPEN